MNLCRVAAVDVAIAGEIASVVRVEAPRVPRTVHLGKLCTNAVVVNVFFLP